MTDNGRSLHRTLGRYFNGGAFSRLDKLLVLLFPGFVARRNAGRVMTMAHDARRPDKPVDSVSHSIGIKPYAGKTREALALAQFARDRLQDDILCLLVHGSVATGEIINYSDFDALVIIRDAVLGDRKRLARLALNLSRARKYLYRFDSLQHHGWFVLRESDLQHLGSTQYPVNLFEHSKCLLPEAGIDLQVTPVQDSAGVKTNFVNVCNSILQKIEAGRITRDYYELKTLLSEFMLLPALFLQLAEPEGVEKKHSFQRLDEVGDAEARRAFARVSEIRADWDWNPGPILKFLLTETVYLRPLVCRFMPLALSGKIRALVTDELLREIRDVTLKLRDMAP